MDRSQVINFGAGPSALPLPVLEEASRGLLNYNGTGIGLAELSHRSKDFQALTDSLNESVRTLLDVPKPHSILFTQGGGCGQFSSVVLNLLAKHYIDHPQLKEEERVLDYVVTGSWSNKAAAEAKRLLVGRNIRVNIVIDARKHSADGKSFDNIPPTSEWKFTPGAVLVYYCENETVDGVQFPQDSFPIDLVPEGVPVVADYSSSFLSRPISQLPRHAVIYAGAQKNVGPAGLTIIVAHSSVLVDTTEGTKLGAPPVPLTMTYKCLADSGSLYNTPPMFAMYVAGLVLKRQIEEGGLVGMGERNERKQAKLYLALKEGEDKGVLRIRVKEGGRSWMNVTFEVKDGKEGKFLEGAERKGLKQLKGHRSVGGIRASLYNAVTEQQVDSLIAYVKEFISQESS